MALTTTNLLKDVVNQLVTQLRAITSGSGYNNTLTDNQVKKGFKTYDAAPYYPIIYLSYIGVETEQKDQQVSEDYLAAELFAYVREEVDPIDSLLEFLSDIENAIMTDPELGDYVYGLTLNVRASAKDDYGIGIIGLRAKSTFLLPT